ncbi:MAG: putative metal-binding motif-containing protein [bacterium]|nr:putative metal-binding motif-containing protein [bacterium]
MEDEVMKTLFRSILAVVALATVPISIFPGCAQPGTEDLKRGAVDAADPYDKDGDKFTVATGPRVSCTTEEDCVITQGLSGGDCDDNDRLVYPRAPERCNGRDDNCDSLIDGSAADADCGAGRVCQAGGVCGVAPPSCVVTAAFDSTCNTVDDDCDGQTDEDFAPAATSCGTGACASTGTTSCVAGVVQNSCVAGTPAASEGACNGIDNDCDGQIDDGCTCTDPGPLGDAACAPSVPTMPAGYVWGCSSEASVAVPGVCTTCKNSDGDQWCDGEICNNDLDDDGDGQIDEECAAACLVNTDCAVSESCIAGQCLTNEASGGAWLFAVSAVPTVAGVPATGTWYLGPVGLPSTRTDPIPIDGVAYSRSGEAAVVISGASSAMCYTRNGNVPARNLPEGGWGCTNR